MSEKRKFDRFQTKLKTKFEYFEGDPESIDMNKDKPIKSKGLTFDISKGGIFIITNERVVVGIPIISNFSIKGKKFRVNGSIVRTGLLKNNPSEVAQKFKKFSSHGDAYIAVEFNDPIEEFREENLD